MKKISVQKISILFSFVFLFALQAMAWGPTGHRIVGEIAQRKLSVKAAAAVKQILNGHRLPDVANWADDIRSDADYKKLPPYHYISIPADFKSYEESPKSAGGDTVIAINTLVDFLKTGNQSALDKVPAMSTLTREQALKLLVHFIGDIHQPLHVGYTNDQGGNGIKVNFMDTKTVSNLHAIWDSDIIDHTKLSFTEYATIIDHASSADEQSWQTLNPVEWANEAIPLRAQLYIYPDKQPAAQDGVTALPLISYDYIYKNRDLMEKRLLQGGVRLAYVLNTLFQ